MTEAATVAQLTARPSSAADCPRKAVYQATVDPDREPTDRERRVMYRGFNLGRDYADWVASIDCRVCQRHVAKGRRTENHRSCTVERERVVQTPVGPGHIDIYHRETRTILEVLTSMNGSDQIPRKVRQTNIYQTYDPDASDLAQIVLVNPVDLSEERVTVRLTDERRAETHELMRQVCAALEGGALPERVCRKPSDAQSHFCRYADTCFQGWEPPPLEEVVDHEVRVIANQLYQAKETERVQNQHVRITERGRKNLEQELAQHLDPGEYQVGDLRVVRSPRTRETFSLKSARAAGIPEPLIREHTKLSTYDVWSLSGEPDPEADIPWPSRSDDGQG